MFQPLAQGVIVIVQVEDVDATYAGSLKRGLQWRWMELKFSTAETTLLFERRKDDKPSASPILVLLEADLDTTM